MSTLAVVVLALVSGTHAATWGAVKDTPFEGFRPVSFARSIFLAVVLAVLLAAGTDLETTAPPVVLVGLLYATERLATELWKSFLREDDQSAYAIPMRIAVRGRPIDDRSSRYLTGLGVLAGLLLLGGTAARLQPAGGGPSWLLWLVGGLGGWLTALGGAWKDAPVEGFSAWKFLRSPVVATAWAVAMSPFTGSWVVLGVAAGGLAVLSIETYKTFFTGGRPPGKFDGKPMRAAGGLPRERCRRLHSATYAALACVAGSSALVDRAQGARAAEISLVALTVVAAAMASLVPGRHAVRPAPVWRRVGAGAARS